MTSQSAAANARFIKEAFHDKGHYPNYEDTLEKAYRLFLKPGQKIIDIGAHSGRHTEKFIDIIGPTGTLWAFEPLPPFAAVLNQRFGQLSNVTLERLAFSNRVGDANYVYVTNAPEESGLKERIYNIPDPIQENITVKVSTVDTYFADVAGIDYVKIDIEGGEIDCLDGMQSFLRANRPYMSVEYGFPGYSKYGNQARSLYDRATHYDMVVSDMFGAIVESVEDWPKVCDVATWDFFLVPRERADAWKAAFSGVHFPDYFLPTA